MNLENKTNELFEQLREMISNQAEESRMIAVDLGELRYDEIFPVEQMLAKYKTENPEAKDLLLMMNHPPTIDFGRRPENNRFFDNSLQPYDDINSVIEKMKQKGIHFSLSQRPGGPVYLGPGQLVVHPVVNCYNANVKDMADGQHKLDLIMKEIVNYFGINDVKVKDPLATGDKRDIYMPPEALPADAELGHKIGSKIAAFTGLDPRTSVMYNGFTLFASNNSTYGFEHIPACGYEKEQLGVTSIQEVLEHRGSHYFTFEDAKKAAIPAVQKVFGYSSISPIIMLKGNEMEVPYNA